MAADLNLYLVRHDESAANLGKGLNRTLAHHAVPLSPNGDQQAVEASQFLKAVVEEAHAADQTVAV
jgi:broad specificity phosphatase PhoE